MPIDLYPSVAKVKRNGVFDNLPGFVPQVGDASAQQMIASAENSTTAQYSHPKNSYFRLNGVLYKAVSNINVGDTIAIGSNCVVDVLGDDVTTLINTVGEITTGLDEEYRVLTQADIGRGVWENGRFVSWNVRLCTNPPIPIKKGDRIGVESDNLQVTVFEFIGEQLTTGTQLLAWTIVADKTYFTMPDDGSLYIMFKKPDGSQIALSDFDATIEIYSTILGRIDTKIYNVDTSLSNKIDKLKSSLITINDFEYGNIVNGYKTNTSDSRFRNKYMFCFPDDIVITPKLGFQFNINAYSENYGTWSNSGWVTSAYTIPAFTRFNIVLADTANAYKNASYLELIYNSFTFEIDSIDSLNEKSSKFSTNIIPLAITDDMKGWTYYRGYGADNHQPVDYDAITFAVPMSKGDYIRIHSGFSARMYYANYSNGSLDDKTTLISTLNPQFRKGEEYFFVDGDYTVFISVVRDTTPATTGDYSDFPSGIDICICARNYDKYIGLNDAIYPDEAQEKAFVSSFNEIEWEDHAKNFAEMFNNLTYGDSFLFFTDCHIMHMSNASDRANCMWKPRVRKALSYIQQLFYATPCNTILNGGDWLGSYDTQDQALYMLSYLNGAMREKFQDHFAMLVGNHDTNYQGYIDSESSEMDGILSQGAINATYCSGHDKSYFLYHAPTYDLYCFDSGIETSELTSSYYTDQVKWFANALTTNNNDHVVIFIHMIYKTGTTVGALFNQLSLCAKAFNERSTYTYDNETYDYTDAVGKVAFAIGGHTHEDTTGTINDIPFVISKNASGYSNFTTLPLDLCLIDWTNSKLKLYRAEIGETTGETRELNIIT